MQPGPKVLLISMGRGTRALISIIPRVTSHCTNVPLFGLIERNINRFNSYKLNLITAHNIHNAPGIAGFICVFVAFSLHSRNPALVTMFRIGSVNKCTFRTFRHSCKRKDGRWASKCNGSALLDHEVGSSYNEERKELIQFT